MPEPRRNVALEQLMKASTIGSNFAFAVGGMGILGWLLDRWLKTGHLCLLIGLGVGLLGGGYRFILDARQASRQAADESSRASPRPAPPGPGPRDSGRRKP